METTHQPIHPNHFDGKILDGAAVVHFLKSDIVNTFADYFVFLTFIMQQLQNATRVDLVWDHYLATSIKDIARDKRGSGIRIKVWAQAKIPKKWNISFVILEIKKISQVPEGKTIFITSC